MLKRYQMREGDRSNLIRKEREGEKEIAHRTDRSQNEEDTMSGRFPGSGEYLHFWRTYFVDMF